MTPLEIRDRLIADAIASVNKHETRDYRHAGCLEGLAICGKLDIVDDYLTVITMRLANESAMRRGRIRHEAYWRHRSATVQIEYIFERLKIVWKLPGPYSAMAVLHVARLIGNK